MTNRQKLSSYNGSGPHASMERHIIKIPLGLPRTPRVQRIKYDYTVRSHMIMDTTPELRVRYPVPYILYASLKLEPSPLCRSCNRVSVTIPVVYADEQQIIRCAVRTSVAAQPRVYNCVRSSRQELLKLAALRLYYIIRGALTQRPLEASHRGDSQLTKKRSWRGALVIGSNSRRATGSSQIANIKARTRINVRIQFTLELAIENLQFTKTRTGKLKQLFAFIYLEICAARTERKRGIGIRGSSAREQYKRHTRSISTFRDNVRYIP
ncbi:unnamed protein product [Trichogramma brassicae]|uniref:Uncharacterized protein n=1 Tax=Trichogramma brassicae TaxID=86971 RepID=A0A6H5IJK5_9HYME|nr:unnamed protein product [Trichogramma brassicae]